MRGGGVNLGTSKSGTCKGCRIPTVAEVPGSRGGADNPRPTDHQGVQEFVAHLEY